MHKKSEYFKYSSKPFQMYINEDLEAGKGLWGLFNPAHRPRNSGN